MTVDLNKTRLVEEVPGVPANEQWFLWRNRKVEKHFRSKSEGEMWCLRNCIVIEDVEYFEP